VRNPTRLGAAGVAVAVDQLSKWVVRAAAPVCTEGSCESWHAGPVGVVRTENHDTAFGLLGGPLVMVVAVLGLLLMVVVSRRSGYRSRALAVGIGLQVGGALANLIDRILFGAVTDFIDLVWLRPVVFNPADVALAAGAVIMAGSLWRAVSSQPGEGDATPARRRRIRSADTSFPLRWYRSWALASAESPSPSSPAAMSTSPNHA
jgi:signal peptidase II